MFGRGLDVKKHTCLSITLVNKEFDLILYLSKFIYIIFQSGSMVGAKHVIVSILTATRD